MPVSLTQERFWLIRRLGLVRKTSYPDMPMQLRLSGRLDPAALAHAWREITARHEILRTHFQTFGNVPHQIISPAYQNDLSITDISGLEEARRETEIRELAQQEARYSFDLARGPLLRGRLIRLSGNEHTLFLKAHHVIFDGWSLAVLLRELGALYAAFAHEELKSALPELPLQYADYALWQRRWLGAPALEEELRYWRERLSGLQALRLPTDHARPETPSFTGARISLELSTPLTHALKELARREGATLYMVSLAAFKLLLSRWSGQTDIAVGSPIAGRVHRKTEALIGFFLNIVVIRTRLLPEQTFRTLLAQVRAMTLDACAHQYLPFERLLIALQAPRDPSRHPIFQAQFVFQNTPQPRFDTPGVTGRLSIGERRTARYDLTLELREHEGTLSGYIGYPTDLFEVHTIEGFRDEFQTLLEELVHDPLRPVSSII